LLLSLFAIAFLQQSAPPHLLTIDEKALASGRTDQFCNNSADRGNVGEVPDLRNVRPTYLVGNSGQIYSHGRPNPSAADTLLPTALAGSVL